MGSAFEQNFGGKGANQAVQAARLGASTQMIGMVGSDTYGSQYASSLQAVGVNTTGLHSTQGATGIASIWVGGDGNNAIVIIPGANTQLTIEVSAPCVSAE